MATLILRDTHRGLEKKMESLAKLKRETSVKIRDAASHGDLKENAEYHAAREEQSLIVRKIQFLQNDDNNPHPKDLSKSPAAAGGFV